MPTQPLKYQDANLENSHENRDWENLLDFDNINNVLLVKYKARINVHYSFKIYSWNPSYNLISQFSSQSLMRFHVLALDILSSNTDHYPCWFYLLAACGKLCLLECEHDILASTKSFVLWNASPHQNKSQNGILMIKNMSFDVLGGEKKTANSLRNHILPEGFW